MACHSIMFCVEGFIDSIVVEVKLAVVKFSVATL